MWAACTLHVPHGCIRTVGVQAAVCGSPGELGISFCTQISIRLSEESCPVGSVVIILTENHCPEPDMALSCVCPVYASFRTIHYLLLFITVLYYVCNINCCGAQGFFNFLPLIFLSAFLHTLIYFHLHIILLSVSFNTLFICKFAFH